VRYIDPVKLVVKAKSAMIRASCGDEMEAKMRKEGLYIEGRTKLKADTKELAMKIIIECNQAAADSMIPLLKELQNMGRQGSSRSIEIVDGVKGHNHFGFDGDGSDSIESIELVGERKNNHLKRMEDKNVKKKMTKSSIALVIVPGELSKAAVKLSAVSAAHPAGLSGVQGKTRSKIPYTSHVERMRLAKMAVERMLLPKPEGAGEHSDTAVVDRKGRVKGEKTPYSGYATGVSGMGSQASDNFGRATIIVKPSEIGSSAPEGSTAHTPIKNVRSPKR